ncbi:MAG: 2-oxoglutarate ferredoxin oxidoreductase subunit alpha [Candidatus Marinimicrobia bacterium]|nr:2-oxoglutarate ferredoxin oxidoreductase subunit alpha [Candidatus Neomarinimicrobiota bacterium]
MSIKTKNLDKVVIRFAGDSGDGMQLTGTRFTETTAIVGNDLSTLPDYPAEIRAPAGSLAGVSAFQLHFSSKDIHTPGDTPDVLVAMNPAALKVHLSELLPGGIIIVNENAFSPKNLKLAGYESNPLEDGTVESYELYSVQMSTLVAKTCEGMDISPKTIDRTKNMFALGLLYWIYNRPLEPTIKWLGKKFAKRPELVDSNIKSLNAGYNYGETVEIFSARYNVEKAPLPAGKYRNINGNYATSVGLLAGSIKADIPLYYGGYPITPASDILHTLASFRHFGVKTFQAEDEIAGITSAIGASFAGNLGVTASSGPGIALKAEAIGLAVIAELPLVIVNVQRGGPSTGLPTKTEQSDLFQALYGRNGEAPVPVIAAQTPGDCFYAAFEACKVAIKYRTPVFLLSDGYLANGSEPWSIPNFDDLPNIDPGFAASNDDLPFMPYARDEKTLARPWAIPGTPGLEHRIGGLEKEDVTGNVSYDPENHHKMTELRAQKVQNIADDIPKTEVLGNESGDLLILSWGGTYGSCRSATERLQNDGKKVSHVNLRWINPLPKDLGEIIIRFKNVLIPELNMGQLSKIIRADYLVDAIGLNLVRGRPFKASDIVDKAKELIG